MFTTRERFLKFDVKAAEEKKSTHMSAVEAVS